MTMSPGPSRGTGLAKGQATFLVAEPCASTQSLSHLRGGGLARVALRKNREVAYAELAT